MNLDDQTARLKKRGCCFRCLYTSHVSKRCKVRVNCENSGKRHHAVMCPNAKTDGYLCHKEANGVKNVEHFKTLPNPTCSSNVFLQTLVVLLRSENEDFAERALKDTRSQKSCIMKEATVKMNYIAVRETTLVHTLFGAADDRQRHLEYRIFVSDVRKKYHCTFNVLHQEKICSEIRLMPEGFFSKELEANGIDLTDKDYFPLCSSPIIHLLIGADIVGQLMTGKILNFSCGLTTIKTLFGWTLFGKSPSSSNSNSTMMVIDLLVNECIINDL
ncbi:hypothetical protein HNY73_005333 [Argiope bruennichi]|uniref:Peptidase aspartic putative domain-containing protein n=1 Tax=Argiope bruennichi TaxID=94029 RepID=A0A8T0FH15_ARGBR|nr:hypothetical protein HNY73_005333 [Argiope bruennichi]